MERITFKCRYISLKYRVKKAVKKDKQAYWDRLGAALEQDIS